MFKMSYNVAQLKQWENNNLPDGGVGGKTAAFSTCGVDEMTLCTPLSDTGLGEMAVGEILVSI